MQGSDTGKGDREAAEGKAAVSRLRNSAQLGPALTAAGVMLMLLAMAV